MGDLLAMGGYGFYVWMSYGACALAIAAEAFALTARRRRAIDEARANGAEAPRGRVEALR
jgi:heme exporter protein D